MARTTNKAHHYLKLAADQHKRRKPPIRIHWETLKERLHLFITVHVVLEEVRLYCKPTNLLWQMRRLLNKYLLIAWTDKIIHNLTAWHRVSLKDISSPSIFMFQLKCTPTLLATPGPVQINNSSTRWNSNEDKQLWVLSAPPGHWHTKLPFITCCKIFYSHLPHANEGAHVYSWGELKTTFHSIGWLSEPKEWAEQG